MRKGLKAFLVAGLLSLVCSFTALAGWEQQGDGKWKYRDEETGKYLKEGWYWLDGNHDGVSERYYFSNYVLDIYKGEWGDGRLMKMERGPLTVSCRSRQRIRTSSIRIIAGM